MLVAENSSYIITRFILDRAPEFTQQMHQTEDGKNYGVFLLCVHKCVQGRRPLLINGCTERLHFLHFRVFVYF